MSRPNETTLSRRERQIMEIVHGLGEATAREVREALPDPPSYSAVRATMRILEEKGHLKHRRRGQQYAYKPTASTRRAKRSAMARLVGTLFGGSREEAFAALLDLPGEDADPEELERLRRMIEDAKENGR